MSKGNQGVDFNRIFNRLVIVITIGIFAHLVFLLLTTDKAIISHLNKLKPSYILVILALISVPWLGHSIRLLIWTDLLKVPLKFKECFRIAVTTDLGSSITPTLIGGGPIKLGMLMKKGISAGKAGTLTLLGGFEDFLMYVGSFLLAVYFLRETIIKAFSNLWNLLISNAYWIALAILVIYFFRTYFSKTIAKVFPRRIRSWISRLKTALKKSVDEMKEAFKLIWNRGKIRFIISFSIVLIQWTAKFTILIVILSALGLEFDAFQMYLQQWLVYLSMIFIPTPGATGGAEASFYFIFNGEIDIKFLPLIVSVWRFFTYYMILFSAVVFVQLFSIYDLRFRNQK